MPVIFIMICSFIVLKKFRKPFQGIDPGQAFNGFGDFFMFGDKQVFEALVVGGDKLF
jgi:hypothetical protein